MMGLRAFLVLLLAQAGLAAAEVVQVALQRDVEVSDSVATLGQIAILSGDERSVELLVDVPIQRLPDLAQRRVTAERVNAVVRQQVPGITIQIEGDAATVSRQVDRVSVSQLHDAAMAHLRSRLPSNAEVTIDVTRPATAQQLPSDAAELQLVAEPLVAAVWGEVPYRIRLVRNDVEIRRAMVVMQVRVAAQVPVAAHDLARGAILGLDDLVMQRRVMNRPGSNQIATIEALVGKRLMRAVAAGEPVSASRVREPPVVHGGSNVVMVYRRNSFELTAQGQALADGVVGDLVRVRQPNGEIVQGRVTARGEVLINHR